MIAYLEGKVLKTQGEGVVVFTSGVGYEVFVVDHFPQPGDDIALYIFDYIREDRRELYGFAHEGAKAVFEKLIDISGVGPKLAGKILSAVPYETLVNGILAGDLVMLTNISGVGKKTAQKIILELKGVLVEQEADGATVQIDTEVMDALVSLGYKERDCRDVLEALTGETVEDRIREALRQLA